MSRYDFGFLTVFWGDNDPQGRKKDPLRPPGGPGQPAARRVKSKKLHLLSECEKIPYMVKLPRMRA